MLTLAGALLLMTTNTYAVIPTFTAYTDKSPGNQAYGGNLGNDFTVNTPIVVTALCAFNSTGNAFAAGTTINVGIFSITTTMQVGSSATFTNGSPGTSVSTYDRCMTLGTPIFLPAGNYSIVANGFNSNDLNGNSNIGGFAGATTDTGGGLITFSTNGRYDASATLDLPTITGAFTFQAGNFQFQQALPPLVTKTFGPTTSPKVLQVGGTTSVSITLTAQNTPLSGLAFTDTLPVGMDVANPTGLTGNCGGVAFAGSGKITLTGGSLGALGSCTISANVTSTTLGTYLNSTGAVTNDQGLTGTAGTDTLDVVAPPTITKSFSDSEIQLLYIGTWLNFTITNPTSNPIPATGIAFTDTLPSGLIVANDTAAPVKGTCDAGTITAVPGTGTISLSGATLAAGASCTFSVAVLANPNAPSPSLGRQNNTTGPIQAFPIPNLTPVVFGVTGGTAWASVDVWDLFLQLMFRGDKG
jgi:uncharacterized repeat protein (TIGR01451 family)